MKLHRTVWFLMILFTIAACTPSQPVPKKLEANLQAMMEGYNEQDARQFTSGFASVMFSGGVQVSDYQNFIDELWIDHGPWESMEVVSHEGRTYTWRVEFQTGESMLEVDSNESFQIVNLRFR